MWRFSAPVAGLAISSIALGLPVPLTQRKLACEFNPPKLNDFPSSLRRGDSEYLLVSTGTRRVTFLGIAVYDIGIYIDIEDASKMRNVLRNAHFEAQKAALKTLTDPTAGRLFLEKLIPNLSFAIRIVPVRNTDIAHIRDGFVRGILARESTPDQTALKEFKDFFPNPQKALKKGTVMTLFASKGLRGQIQMTLDGHEYGIFDVSQGRNLTTAFIANYICGVKVASESVRQEFVKQILSDAELV